MQILTGSRIQFVYPFFFEGDKLPQRASAIGRATWPKTDDGTLPVWRSTTLKGEDFLPHVTKYLTAPDTFSFEMQGAAFIAPDGFNNNDIKAWRIEKPSAKIGDIPFRFDAAPRVILFHTGVGFVLFDVVPLGTEATDWLNLVHYFRFIGPHRAKRRSITAELKGSGQPFFPKVARGYTSAQEERYVRDLVAALLNTGRLEAEKDEWWKDAFVPEQMLPFASLLMMNVPPGETNGLLYQVHNFFHCNQVLKPTADDLPPRHPGFLPYADGCWFIVSLDGVAYLSFDRTEQFFVGDLPGHLRSDYLSLFLLALHQRFALAGMMERVAKVIPPDDARAEDEKSPDKVAQREQEENECLHLYSRLMQFNARGHFPQAAQRDHHHRFYLKCQEQFQVERLHRDVNQELGRLREYVLMQRERREELLQQRQNEYSKQQEAREKERAKAEERREREDERRDKAEERRDKQFEHSLGVLTFVIGVPALICGLLGINMPGITVKEGETGIQIWHAIALMVTGALIGGCIWALIRRIRKEE